MVRAVINCSALAVITTLTCAPFTDADDAGHAATQWQVAEDASFAAVVWDSGQAAAAITTPVPGGALSPWTPYFWRARFQDGSGDAGTEWSPWSEPEEFRTAHAFPFTDDFSEDKGWTGYATNKAASAITSCVTSPPTRR